MVTSANAAKYLEAPLTSLRGERKLLRYVVCVAKKADDYKLSTAEHAENIAKELSLTPQGRQRCLEILRGIRTGHRQLSAKIRKNLPLNAGKRQRISFLAWLEATIQTVEGRSSDELPE